VSMECSIRRQSGVSLVVGLIMLVLITVMVTSAVMLSTTNLRAVGNMQSRDEALAAANTAMEQVISGPFFINPVAQTIEVDIDNDDTIDYVVALRAPQCIGDAQLPAAAIPPSSLSLGPAFNFAVANFFQTLWELDATVTHVASGTSVRVRQGVRAMLTQVQYNQWCPPGGASPSPSPSP
jgi:hypothetical protein